VVFEVSLDELAGEAAPSVLARLRAASPVAWVEAMGGWLVISHELAVAVMRDPSTFTVDDPRFSTARVVGPSMLSLDGVAHHRHRAPFASPFRPAQVSRRFGVRVEALTADLVERIAADGVADLRAALAGPLAVGVVADALGLRDADAPTVLRWYSAIVEAVSTITAGGAPDAAAAQAMAELAAAVSDHREDSLLAGAYDALDPEEVVANAAVLMFGGIETTEAMISNALVHLLSRPYVLAAVAADPALLPVAVEESLRLEPAAAVVDRYATRPAALGGQQLEARDLVRVSIAGANRDPAVFSEPDAFDLHRPNLRAQLAFARGPHVCVAMDLARLETVVAVQTVLARLAGLRLVEPVVARGLVFRKPDAVPVRWGI
jgi:cytochrome P450